MRFYDRADAGRVLAESLHAWKGTDAVVLALPRGGIPVGRVVADALGLPLDAAVVRKMGVPYQPELAMGAVGEAGVRVLNPEVISQAGISSTDLAFVEHTEREELARRVQSIRAVRPLEPLAGRTAIIIDDGLATGATAEAACAIVRARGASSVVMAAPVGSPLAAHRLHAVADEVVIPYQPESFRAVGQFYDHFNQVSDDTVIRLLAEGTPTPEQDMSLDLPALTLPALVRIPNRISGVVLFVHGSGSSRHSPRNRSVAARLSSRGLATVLFDLLLPDEEHRREHVFDVHLLADRLVAAIDWVHRQPHFLGQPIFLFGASTGSAAALVAATSRPVSAIVSRGGRPDLAGNVLSQVTTPTLLIVGGADYQVLELNREAMRELAGEVRLSVIPGATHLFEEPGALDEVAQLARDWFLSHASVEATV